VRGTRGCIAARDNVLLEGRPDKKDVDHACEVMIILTSGRPGHMEFVIRAARPGARNFHIPSVGNGL